ncbi:reverse transcriptase domain-containing protein [Tanacetum coccineum]|uniref:Reverse transcriptase domain-containing protein n=1 Tax=Tanacetum coccineum TaxID=301880 RepID=A0ABQ5AFG9_9ASTR
MEKLVLALVHANKWLKSYFQAHPIIVITDQPIKQVLSKPKIAGRLQKWSIELGEYDINYRQRVSIKGKILADFIVEQPEDDSLAAPMEIEEELPDPWTLFTNGSSCIDGSGAGLILTGLEGTQFSYALRFGLPGEIISDNEKQFRDNSFKDWCEKLNIRQRFASVKNPQANGLVERANRSLGEGIDMVQNDEALKLNLDLLEEKREQAAIREARSKAKMKKYYNSKVRNTSFKLGDLVYRNNDAIHVEDGGKLGLKWEGPYEVTKALGNGAYKLRDRNRKLFPRTWNVRNLKKCYVHEM